MYEMTVICLDGSKKCKFLFFFRLSFVDLFTRWFTRCERRTEKKVGGTDFIIGKKSLAGGTLWDRELHTTSYLLGTRYARERGVLFLFLLFTFIYFCFFFSKGFNQTLMYCPQNKKEETEKEKEKEPAVAHRMTGSNRSVFDF